MKTNFSDDEEDLEALRLAALSSLKKKNEANELAQNQHFRNEKNYNYTRGSFRGGKRRYFPGQAGRIGRNNQFNNQVRNSNLISIPTITDESSTSQVIPISSKFSKKDDNIPKLIRPQDRYASITEQDVENGLSSKFDRYDDNSNSESEEDDEIANAKLARSDSLEALMEELDAEIQEEPKKEKKDKVKVKKETIIYMPEKKVQIEVNIDSNNVEASVDKQESLNSEITVHSETKENLENVPSTSAEKLEIDTKDEIKVEDVKQVELKFNKNQRSPGQRKIPNRRINGRVFNPDPSFVVPSNNPILVPNLPIMNPLQPPQFTTVYNAIPPFAGPDLFSVNVPPPNFVPPPGLQPHIMPIDVPPSGFTDFNAAQFRPLVVEPSGPLASIPMGPLSPRSAAFVLQNRAIVEKRKRSPRRSYSRSPSPLAHRSRYSNSPPSRRSVSPFRRSFTPTRRSASPKRRSMSPRRSPFLRRSLSPYTRHREKTPRKDSPRRSPRRVRDSPLRSPKRSRDSPKRSREARKTPLKDRLGTKGKIEEKDIKKKEETVPSISKNEDLKVVDPVLEARKKKFESKEMKVKEGVIRLKPKEEMVLKKKREENSSKTNEEKVENVKPKEKFVKKVEENIFTKPVVKEETSTRIVLLPKNEETSVLKESPPVDQLEEAMNELEMLLKDDEALELTAKVDDLFTDEETDQENEGRFKAMQVEATEEKPVASPFRKISNGSATTESSKKREIKCKWNAEQAKKEHKLKKSKKEPLTNPIENRKIEIKIRNPTKYEKTGRVQSSVQVSTVRKVELSKLEEFGEEESEPEIVVENEDDEVAEDVSTCSREGDLRAQLSRKRAERQNKLPTVEGVQSRLLQSALEGAVFKKKKSKKKDKETKDMKLPIHLRLGITHDSDIFAEAATEKISRKKSKKRKHARLEQV